MGKVLVPRQTTYGHVLAAINELMELPITPSHSELIYDCITKQIVKLCALRGIKFCLYQGPNQPLLNIRTIRTRNLDANGDFTKKSEIVFEKTSELIEDFDLLKIAIEKRCHLMFKNAECQFIPEGRSKNFMNRFHWFEIFQSPNGEPMAGFATAGPVYRNPDDVDKFRGKVDPFFKAASSVMYALDQVIQSTNEKNLLSKKLSGTLSLVNTSLPPQNRQAILDQIVKILYDGLEVEFMSFAIYDQKEKLLQIVCNVVKDSLGMVQINPQDIIYNAMISKGSFVDVVVNFNLYENGLVVNGCQDIILSGEMECLVDHSNKKTVFLPIIYNGSVLGVLAFVVHQSIGEDNIFHKIDSIQELLQVSGAILCNLKHISRFEKSSKFPAMKLSRREKEVMVGIADGLTIDQIGNRLVLASSTIKTIRKRLCKKIGVSRNAHLIRMAIDWGLVDNKL